MIPRFVSAPVFGGMSMQQGQEAEQLGLITRKARGPGEQSNAEIIGFGISMTPALDRFLSRPVDVLRRVRCGHWSTKAQNVPCPSYGIDSHRCDAKIHQCAPKDRDEAVEIVVTDRKPAPKASEELSPVNEPFGAFRQGQEQGQYQRFDRSGSARPLHPPLRRPDGQFAQLDGRRSPALDRNSAHCGAAHLVGVVSVAQQPPPHN